MTKKKQDTKKIFLETPTSDTAIKVAYYYGFKMINTPIANRKDLELERKIKESHTHQSKKQVIDPALEKIALIREFYESDLKNEPLPLEIFYETPDENEKNKRRIQLNILGSTKNINEATLIQTAYALLSESDYGELCVEINSLGDKDTVGRFQKELQSYIRKHINHLPIHLQQIVKKDPTAILGDHKIKNQEVLDEVPRSIDFLSEENRTHFRGILEYLEQLGIPYEINNKITGDRNYSSQTVFVIKGKSAKTHGDELEILASGSRFGSLSRKMGHKKILPAVGITIKIAKAPRKKSTKKNTKPQFFFMQLGHDAKLRSLQIMEMLRQARIPIYQSLSRDRIGSQINIAERMNFPYVLILGQKEVVDKTIIVRDNETHSQSVVPIDKLVEYLKKQLKKK